MKSFFFFILFCFFIAFGAQATIHQVNNNNPSAAQFTSLQAAIDAAVDGDTIYLHGSPTFYGNVTLNKRLVIFGPGFAPQSQLAFPADVGVITLNTATNPITGESTSATGSELYGFRIYQASFTPNINEIHFERMRFAHPQTTNVVNNLQGYNHTFIGCFFTGRVNSTNGQINYNIQFYNCIFTSTLEVFATGHFNNLTVTNCIFTRQNAGATLDLVATTSNASRITFTNNIFIFYNARPNCANCVFVNNMSFGAGVIDLNGEGLFSENNFIAVSLGFENFPFHSGYNPVTHDLNLTEGSPAKGAGVNGVDLGVMGGEDVYFRKGGEPRLPKFELLQLLTPAVPQGEDVKVRVRATVVKD